MLVGRQVLLAETGRAGSHVLSGAGRPRHGLTPGWPWQDPRANTDPECSGGKPGSGRGRAGFCRVTRPWAPNLLCLHSREEGLWLPRAMSVHLCAVFVCVCARAGARASCLCLHHPRPEVHWEDQAVVAPQPADRGRRPTGLCPGPPAADLALPWDARLGAEGSGWPPVHRRSGPSVL